MRRKTIFLVDDSMTNLKMGKSALSESYNIFTLDSGAKLIKLLERTKPDLILLDVEMPDMSGYDVIRIIKDQPETADIPIIFLTAKSDGESELTGLSLGAIDYIVKPFSPPLLRKRIEVHLLVESQRQQLINYNDNLHAMVDAKTKTVIELQNAILKTIAELVECRDDITGAHIERTQDYLRVFLDAVLEQDVYREELSSWDIGLVLESAQLHDVGKIAIRDCILQKPGRLTPAEYEEIKEHAAFGVKIIDKIKKSTSEQAFLEHARILAGTHHEKWDGSGYPMHLSGHAIPLQGRVMAIVDVYDALVSERPYKQAFPHEEAIDIIAKGRGSHFDPALVDVFLSISDRICEIATLWKNVVREDILL